MTQDVLAVAACSGARCRALRGLRLGDEATPRALRAAVAARPDAALVSTDCLGACHLACLVAVGPAVYAGDGRLTWTRPPVTVALAERHISALAEWISSGAPDDLPEALRRTA